MNEKFNQNKSTDDRPSALSCTYIYTVLSYYGCRIFLTELNSFKVIKVNTLLQTNPNGSSKKTFTKYFKVPTSMQNSYYSKKLE